MRKRVRHFNPRDCGASVALDSRFGFSLSDGALVSQWTDRTRNSYNATRASSTNQPTYETYEQGGQPALRFFGGDDWLDNSSLPSIGNGNYSAILIARISSGAGTPFQIGNSSTQGTALLTYSNGASVNYGRIGGDFLITTSPSAFGSSTIVSLIYNGSTFTPFYNGAATNPASASSGFPNITSGYVIGRYGGGSQYWNGFVMQSTIFASDLTSSMRKMIERISAFSFKIQCS